MKAIYRLMVLAVGVMFLSLGLAADFPIIEGNPTTLAGGEFNVVTPGQTITVQPSGRLIINQVQTLVIENIEQYTCEKEGGNYVCTQ